MLAIDQDMELVEAVAELRAAESPEAWRSGRPRDEEGGWSGWVGLGVREVLGERFWARLAVERGEVARVELRAVLEGDEEGLGGGWGRTPEVELERKRLHEAWVERVCGGRMSPVRDGPERPEAARWLVRPWGEVGSVLEEGEAVLRFRA